MLTVTEFRARFTQSEKRRIYSAARVSVDVQIYLDDLASTGERGVDVASSGTIGGVQAMAAGGLLDEPVQERVAALLASPPADDGGPTIWPTVWPSIGGYTIGQAVQCLAPWDADFPGPHTVVGFGPECVELSCGCSMATDNIKPA